jgi:hypothetical protein
MTQILLLEKYLAATSTKDLQVLISQHHTVIFLLVALKVPILLVGVVEQDLHTQQVANWIWCLTRLASLLMYRQLERHFTL